MIRISHLLLGMALAFGFTLFGTDISKPARVQSQEVPPALKLPDAPKPMPKGPAEAKDAKEGGKNHPRGYVRPADHKERVARSWMRHGHIMRAMAHVTIADYDARQLGICTPIKDQGQCFPAGTWILLPDKTERMIEDVKVGWTVITAQGNLGSVSRLSKRWIDEKITTIAIDFASVDLTNDHPVMTPRGWVKAAELQVGELVKRRTHLFHEWAKVTQASRKNFKGFVYDLEVSGDNSFVANNFGVHNCGSCWCFGGTELCESAMIKAGAMTLNQCILSTQYTLDCYSNGGCNGDNSQTVTDHAKSVGLPLESDYGPYQAAAGTCKSPTPTLYKITDAGYVSQNQVASFQELMDSIVKYGVIQVNLDAGCLNSYNGGVITTGDGSSVDHAVLMEGFHCERNTDGSINMAKSYLIIRNSWGASWGENGRFRIMPGIWSIGDGALWAVATGPAPVPVPPGPTPPPIPPGPSPVPPLPVNSATLVFPDGSTFQFSGTWIPISSSAVDISGLTPAEQAGIRANVSTILQAKKAMPASKDIPMKKLQQRRREWALPSCY